MAPLQLSAVTIGGHHVQRWWVASEMPAVLIVDSYSDEGEMYADYLRSIGSTVEYVRTPEQAFSFLETNQPVVIVTDMVFERSAYDGPGFMQAVRARPQYAIASFIVVSGFTRPADRERARAAGADRFLVKPCTPDELSRHVVSLIAARGRSMHPESAWPEDAHVPDAHVKYGSSH